MKDIPMGSRTRARMSWHAARNSVSWLVVAVVPISEGIGHILDAIRG
jgi:hypothetical protein